MGLSPKEWARPTECPAYSVKGVVTHILGDNLSLLSRQRDGAENGLQLLSCELPAADFPTLLDTFNDRWVATARFLSTEVLTELLRLCGEWTAAYYQKVDPEARGESVGFSGVGRDETSPLWHVIAREYVERWIHRSQIRRALGLSSLYDRQFLVPGIEVVAAALRMEPVIPPCGDGEWAIGEIVLGRAAQAAAVLTRAYPPEQLPRLPRGPSDLAERLAPALGRP